MDRTLVPLGTIAGADLIPDEPEDRQILFDLFLLEKAVYELGYEIDNRPDWVSIPLEGISYIVDM